MKAFLVETFSTHFVCAAAQQELFYFFWIDDVAMNV